ncbi:hypothetical protein [Rufibacter sp. LB8]|uniref:hypothetical protein n=1 Tax=Rufibacter sp. LB8 TaxID=2777781 RepID=UPI00178C4337|nr:hypothetical protein [Rufibacter sp. LB8]
MRKNIVITITEDCLDRLHIIASTLKQDGLQITNIFEYGVITGNVEDKSIEKLRSYDEILSLKEDQSIQISPPDSEIQ